MIKIKKRYAITGAIVTVLFLVLFFLSTFIRHYVTKNSVELLGRKVELGALHINYLKVAVRVHDLMVYEANATDTFAGFKEFYLNFDPWNLVNNEYAVSAISLDSLYVKIEQDGDRFNFSDLIPPTDSATVDSTVQETTDVVQFSVENIRIARGKIDFYDKAIDNRLLFDDLNLNLPVIAWNSEQSEVGAEFQFGERGTVFVGADVNHSIGRYTINLKTEDLELHPISNYLKASLNTGGISGLLHANLFINGDMEQVADIVVSGTTHLDTFKLWTPEGNNILTFDQLAASFDSIDLGRSYFSLNTIALKRPILVARLDKDMSNIERLLLPLMAETVDSTEQMDTLADSAIVRYKLDSLLIRNGFVAFHDNTLNRAFQYDFKEMNVTLTDLMPDNDSIPIKFAVNMNDQGQLNGQTSFSMVDPFHIHLNAELDRLRLMSFSPYTEYYIARPITQGDFNYELSIAMTKKEMVNGNTIRINELEFGNKTGDTTATNAPIRLGLYLLKDPQDVIAIDMPVTGDPSEPDFSVRKIIWKSFMNLLIKTAASPFNALGSLVGTRPEDLESIPLAYAQDSLAHNQKQTLTKIGEILTKKPELFFELVQETHTEEEKAHLAVYLSKQKMLTDKMPLRQAEDSLKLKEALAQLSDNDEKFLRYLNQQVAGADTLGVMKASQQFIGASLLNQQFKALLIQRNQLVSAFLRNEMQVDSTSFEVRTADLRNIPEELKSPNFRVEVSIK